MLKQLFLLIVVMGATSSLYSADWDFDGDYAPGDDLELAQALQESKKLANMGNSRENLKAVVEESIEAAQANETRIAIEQVKKMEQNEQFELSKKELTERCEQFKKSQKEVDIAALENEKTARVATSKILTAVAENFEAHVEYMQACNTLLHKEIAMLRAQIIELQAMKNMPYEPLPTSSSSSKNNDKRNFDYVTQGELTKRLEQNGHRYVERGSEETLRGELTTVKAELAAVKKLVAEPRMVNQNAQQLAVSQSTAVASKEVKRSLRHQGINACLGTAAVYLGTRLTVMPAYVHVLCSRMISFFSSPYTIAPLMCFGLYLSVREEKEFIEKSEVVTSMKKNDLAVMRTLIECSKSMIGVGTGLLLLAGIVRNTIQQE